MIVDVDNFKMANDSSGHQAGDLVLRGLAGILRGGCRQSDTAARHDGQEFVVLAPHANLKDAVLMAEKIRTEVELRPRAIGRAKRAESR